MIIVNNKFNASGKEEVNVLKDVTYSTLGDDNINIRLKVGLFSKKDFSLHFEITFEYNVLSPEGVPLPPSKRILYISFEDELSGLTDGAEVFIHKRIDVAKELSMPSFKFKEVDNTTVSIYNS